MLEAETLWGDIFSPGQPLSGASTDQNKQNKTKSVIHDVLCPESLNEAGICNSILLSLYEEPALEVMIQHS